MPEPLRDTVLRRVPALGSIRALLPRGSRRRSSVPRACGIHLIGGHLLVARLESVVIGRKSRRCGILPILSESDHLSWSPFRQNPEEHTGDRDNLPTARYRPPWQRPDVKVEVLAG
jgi:hypothetical protein